MPKQSTTERKAEGPDHRPEAMPTKKLQKASSQPALNSPPRPTSATDSSLFKSPPPPSLTSNSSIEDSPSSTANSLADKSSASTASIEKSSSAPSTTGDCSTSVLQETRPNHGGEQETKEMSLDEMSLEQLEAYGRSRGWVVHYSDIKYQSDSDFHDDVDYAYGLGEYSYVGIFAQYQTCDVIDGAALANWWR